MISPRTLPSIIIARNIGSAFYYGCEGDFWMVACWLAAAVLTAAVTF